MYCTHCGKEIPDDSLVCGFCGQEVEESVKQELADAQQPAAFDMDNNGADAPGSIDENKANGSSNETDGDISAVTAEETESEPSAPAGDIGGQTAEPPSGGEDVSSDTQTDAKAGGAAVDINQLAGEAAGSAEPVAVAAPVEPTPSRASDPAPQDYADHYYERPLPAPRGEQAKPVSTFGFFVTELLLLLPVINLLLLFIWAFRKRGNPNRKNFARSVLIWLVILLIVVLAGFITMLALQIPIDLNYWLDWLKDTVNSIPSF